jgi:glycosyltransferase involved in cell wall biosynthesis
MRWFTCTPVEFGGGADFFTRDSGLLCRGFQALGMESRAVMPGARKAEDEAELIRTEYANLESSEWWRSLKLDGVVLYAWGRPRFRKVAAAIRDAGVFLVLNQDNGGLVSPLAGFRDWLKEQWTLSGQGRGGQAWLRFCKLTVRGLTVGLAFTDPLRAVHLKRGDVIACVSPKAADCYRRLCRIYGGPELAKRVAVVPHAVEPRFRYGGEPKLRQVACVGRWHDGIQKRPWLLVQVLEALLATDREVAVVIGGRPTAGMERWHQALAADQRARVRLAGQVARDELRASLGTSQVFYSPSAFESFGIAAAEALCCGCSVVAGRSVSMASFEWFVGEYSGRLAEDTVAGHVAALRDELACWAAGQREPKGISAVWGERLHADRVAARVVEMAGN